MKLISWNVNGIRACIGKGFEESFAALDADIFCLQETKCQQGQVKLELPGYYQYWNYANRRGYSGTAVFTKKEPLSVAYGIGIEEHDKEGRVITLEYEKFYLVTVYTPNSQSELRRLEYRMHWDAVWSERRTRRRACAPCPLGRWRHGPCCTSGKSRVSWGNMARAPCFSPGAISGANFVRTA